jgi:methionyl aminopeptidase
MDSNSIIIKTEEQIAGIRKSCLLAKECLDLIGEFVVPGITTHQLDEIIEKHILQAGGTSACRNYNGYPAATCISVNEVICHGVPNNYQLQKGDILNIDVTTIVNGYYGDTSRMYIVEDTDEESKKLLKITKECFRCSPTRIYC